MKSIFNYVLNKNGERKVETELFPDPVSSRSEEDLPARTRGLIKNKIDKCTGCADCVAVCPTQCITLVAHEQKTSFRLWVEKFEIDFASCIFCGKCVESCEPESLVQTKKIQPNASDCSDFVIDFGRGKLE